MHFILDARLLLPQMTGIGRYLTGLAGAYARWPGDDRFDIWMQNSLPADHPIWQLNSERLRLTRLSIDHMNLRQQWVLPRLVRERRPDVFHYPHFDLPAGIPGRVVITLHDLKYIAQPEFFPAIAGPKRLLMYTLMAYSARRAALVITESESTRHDIIRYLKISPEKVRVVYLGFDQGRLSPHPGDEDEAVRHRYGLDQPYLLFVGERRPHKNLTGLLRAFAAFRTMTAEPYRLLIAGKPYAGYQEPEALVEKLDLGHAVHFLDYVPDSSLPALYRQARAFIMLSHYEGFGLPVLEAMACGLPVVAARRTSLPEVVGEAGLLVEPEQPEQVARAILKVTAGEAEREAYIRKGLEWAGRFTWERCARETVEVYREAAG